MIKSGALLLAILFLIGCGKDEAPTTSNAFYFPANTGTDWVSTSIADMGWNENAVQPLKEFLAAKNSRSFMILVNGKIVMEEYFNGHNAAATWEWNSAGKTLISATTGIAAQEGLLNISQKASDYLQPGWTNMPIEKENLITVKNLLTMTTGIDDSKQLIIKPNLTYVADAGNRWAYGNVFQKLTAVVSNAANKDFETYYNEKIKNKTGMDGYWQFGPVYTIYHSTTRSMARFGLLALNKGKWKNEPVINETFFTQSINSSQNINLAYGYFWWLNGKSSYMLPGSQTIFNGKLVPDAPADMYAAMGAADQRLYIIPGKKMVVVRMGEASDPANPYFALSGFDNALWQKINDLIR